jgi:chemotaxis signal transduction protein
VVNLRKRFGLAERGIRLSDYILLAHTLKHAVALVVDAVHGVNAVEARETRLK